MFITHQEAYEQTQNRIDETNKALNNMWSRVQEHENYISMLLKRVEQLEKKKTKGRKS